jgi:DNA/RNA-binding domain of Phe-tRNA-synthetase-like protein
MYFFHSSEIWQEFPRLVAGLLIVDGIHQNLNAEPYLQNWYQGARKRLEEMSESQIPEIAAWRKAFSQMGLKPTKYRCAAEALLRRFKREFDLPRLHPLVDLCNAISLAFALPVAIFDLDTIAEYIEVCHANGSEQYLAFTGELENPSPGEVIFRDAADQVHARRWTFRQSKLSTVSPETRQVLIISEGLHESASQDVPELIDILSEKITAIGATIRNNVILSAEKPRLEFKMP